MPNIKEWNAMALVFFMVAAVSCAADLYAVVANGKEPSLLREMVAMAFGFFFAKNGGGSAPTGGT